MQSSRDSFAEQAVWRQQESLGVNTGQLDGLTALQSVFDPAAVQPSPPPRRRPMVPSVSAFTLVRLVYT